MRLLFCCAMLVGMGCAHVETDSADLWHTPPVKLSGLPGELFVCEAKNLARRGSDKILIIRLQGRVSVIPHHFRQQGETRALSVDAWSKQLNAPLVINAGMYTSALRHMGSLMAHGQRLDSEEQASWRGWLIGDSPPLLIDSDDHPQHPRLQAASHKLQTMMLLDRRAQIRTRVSSRSASRTVLAQDTAGRLLVVMTEGAVTLGDLALWLRDSGLNIVLAINLDGGLESQLALRTQEATGSLRGRYGVHSSGLRAPRLPAVLAFYADEEKVRTP